MRAGLGYVPPVRTWLVRDAERTAGAGCTPKATTTETGNCPEDQCKPNRGQIHADRSLLNVRTACGDGLGVSNSSATASA